MNQMVIEHQKPNLAYVLIVRDKIRYAYMALYRYHL